MVKVIVDTSVWIDYLKHGKHVNEIRTLLEQQRLVTNDVIMAELLPVIMHDKKKQISELLNALERIPVFVNWNNLIDAQLKCLKNGHNKIRLLDLMILQTSIEYSVEIFSVDKHFHALAELFQVKIFKHGSND
jgi:predicted nucleic acid-binding protein